MKYKQAFQQPYTPVRFSHLMSYAGVGSIVRAADGKLMVVVDTRHWLDKNQHCAAVPIPYVRRITLALVPGKELRMPPQAEVDSSKPSGTLSGSYLPAVLFPKWAVCSSCNYLHPYPWRELGEVEDKDPRCQNPHCHHPVVLKQVTWCAVSSQGHLDEVPWHYLAHVNRQDINCRPDYDKAYLKLTADKRGKPLVKCSRCGSQGAYDREQLSVISRQQPWLFKPKPVLGADDTVRVLPVNNPAVYIPERLNALVIPPESRMGKGTLLDRLCNSSRSCRELEAVEQKSGLQKKSRFKSLASEYRTSVAELEAAWNAIKQGYPTINDEDLEGDLRLEEYKAFLLPLENQKEDEDFVTEHQSERWKSLLTDDLPDDLKVIIRCVDNLITAKRLREIQIFKGFHRLTTENDEGESKPPIPPDIDNSEQWLPAIELFGEGVFFTLDQCWLSNWEAEPAIVKRANEIQERYEKAEVPLFQDVTINPRFLLLHTLAHLLIRELESSAGYPAASLHERIYCSKADNMAGILIYTAVPDVVGSLGGIIESAEPMRFLVLLASAFKHAQWCSLDPVCAEHEGQGPGWLNRAACHACALVPEPACDYGNIFLDRIFIKGSQDGSIPGLLDFLSTQ
jgi:hypothetical protein